MKKKRVAVLFGGKSGEHEVSVVSALSVYHALDKNKYDVTLVGIDKTGRWLLPDQAQVLSQSSNPRLIKLNQVHQTVSLLPFESNKNLVAIDSTPDATPAALKAGMQFDVIVPILHGTYGEDGTVQGLFELANLPYVGSGVLGSALGMDKELAKRVMQASGIPVVPFLTARKHEFKKDPKSILAQAEKKFGFPYFVKPANMGSSVGVHKVKSAAEAQSKLEDAFMYDTKVLIEQAINARELECSVLGNHDPKASTVGEIIPNHEFYSYEAKYIDQNGADLNIPAKNMPAGAAEKVQQYAVQAFRALECAGLARVDFFLDKNTNEIYLNEINTIPGFTSISMYPKLWEASGLPYSKLLDRLIELAVERHAEKNSLKTTYEAKE